MQYTQRQKEVTPTQPAAPRTALRIATVAVLHLVCFLGPIALLAPAANILEAHAKATGGGAQFEYLLGFALLSALCISYPILRAKHGGWPLVLGMGVSFFGLQTFMGQIETAYFQYAFPLIDDAELAKLFGRGALTALGFVPLAVWVLRRGLPKNQSNQSPWADVPWSLWARRAPLLALAYVVIYLLFGYFVAWQFADLRQFYTGSQENLGLLSVMRQNTVVEPGFLPFQFLRGLLWVAFSLPVILLVRERRAAAVSLALLMGLFGAQILLPSAFFPPVVRLAHFLETTSSTALFGFLVGWALPLKAPSAATKRRNEALGAALEA